jgi:predicted molibdopterin-dependent oxidoreductase YjgC
VGLTTVFGSGAGTSSYEDFHRTAFILLVGSNAAEAHPIIFHHIMKGVRNGAEMVVVDPRKTLTTRKAHEHLQIAVGSDIALANAMAHVIIRDGLYHQEFVEHATEGFAEFADHVRDWTPARAEAVTGIAADRIESLAKRYAAAPSAMIAWTLGITEHHNAVDNVRALINLALLCGNVGRPGAGLNPLRGQNNVQGGGDMGALPARLPGFQDIEDPQVREKFEKVWGAPIPQTAGYDQTQMFAAMEAGGLRGLYVIGENPAQSDANSKHVRHLLESLDALVVQDIFLTATGELADVVLPAHVSFAESEGTYTNSERRVQRVKAARRAPGEAQDDLWITASLAKAMGYDWPILSARELFDEMRHLTLNYRGMTYDRLEKLQGMQWPVYDETHLGSAVLHDRLWEPETGPKAPFAAVDWEPPVEHTTPEYPFLLTTGRRLPFFNTGVQSNVYDHPHKIGEWMEIHPEDAAKLNISDGEVIAVASPRGRVELAAYYSGAVTPGTVFMTFHFPDEVMTNDLTIDATDPKSGTAEFKAAAVRLERLESHGASTRKEA